MRFESVRVENDELGVFFGDVYTIKDNVDSKSPVNSFRLLKPTADKVCDWLNENIKEFDYFDGEVKAAIKILWNDDEYEYKVVDDVHIITELKETTVSGGDILNILSNARINSVEIGYCK